MILACDVGGTKTDVVVLEPVGGALRIVSRATYRSSEHESLDDIIGSFVSAERPRLSAAGFGIAGPVLSGRVKTTNLPWTVDGERLARFLGLERVSLVNDVEALAWSVPTPEDEVQVTMQQGTADTGNIAVIAAGTGLGYAALLRGERAPRSLASEGGHADFSPGDDLEIELLSWLRHQYDRVSVERVISGPGLFKIYQFLRERDPQAEPPGFAAAFEGHDPTAVVAEAAIEGRCELAERAVLLFLGAYGAEAGNWALRTLSTGGVWLGGGVARKLLVGPPGTPAVWRSRATRRFLDRFRDKGRLSSLVREMPVGVIVSDTAAVLGVGRFALAECSLPSGDAAR